MTHFMEAIVRTFIESKLTPLAVLAALCLGVFAIIATPREEEPQIIVPMMDVMVAMPGASAKEVEKRVTTPMERLIWEIPGVDYVYSMSYPGQSMVIVRFKVGENEEASIVKLYNKLYSHFDLIPPGASKPLIKPRSIDDVPVLALTLSSSQYDSYTLRRIAAELDNQIKSIDDVSLTHLIGGERRQVRALASLLRIAVALNAGEDSPVAHATARINAGDVVFEIPGGRHLAKRLRQARRGAALFEQEFERKAVFRRAEHPKVRVRSRKPAKRAGKRKPARKASRRAG